MSETGAPDAASWHEAGHALIATLLGGTVRCVTLESERDGHDGHTEILWDTAPERDQLERSALVALGGPLAECLFRGDEVHHDPEIVSAWAGDWAEIQDAARRVADPQRSPEDLVRRWWRQVGDWLTEEEERLARIADALHAHGTLDDELFEASIS